MKAAKKMEEEAGLEQSDERLTAEEAPAADEVSVERRSGRRRRSRSAARDVSVNMDELRELVQLIRENDFTEFELERETFRVRFRRGPEYLPVEPADRALLPEESAPTSQGASPAVESRAATASAPSHPGARAETQAAEDQDLHIISSPIVGTFYRSPSPNADSFVKIGSHVESDSVVCIIEAMKLMNEIQAETTGEIVKIYVENGQPVEYGQPLFGIKR